MEKEHHEFFDGIVRDFPALTKCLEKVVPQIETVRARLVEYENKVKAGQAKIEALNAEAAEIEKKNREKLVLMNSNEAAVRGELQRLRDELTQKEAQVMVRERDLAEKQTRLDKVLAAAEQEQQPKQRKAAAK